MKIEGENELKSKCQKKIRQYQVIQYKNSIYKKKQIVFYKENEESCN
jgi:hypothetical protein